MADIIKSPEGMQRLVEAICRTAATDYLYSKKEKNVKDAEIFFKSDWFFELTGLDGKPILKRLDRIKRKEAV